MSGPSGYTSNLDLLADVATRSIDEMIAANALVQLNQQQLDGIDQSIQVLRDLNSVQLSELEKKEISEVLKTKYNIVKRNAKKLEDFGLYPPVKFLNDTTAGGVEVGKRPRNAPVLYSAEQAKEILEQREEAAKRPKRVVNRKTKFIRRITGTYEELDPTLKKSLPDLCDLQGASKFMNILFPTKIVDIWKNEYGKKCRDIYEHSGIEKQCMVVLEKTTEPAKARDSIYANKKCYLCGFRFQNADGLKPSCEHILPIIQAVFLLDLWRPKQKYTKEEFDVLTMEYDWAHTCCNLVKGAKPYLNTIIDKNDPYPRWDFNSEGTRDIFVSIVDGTHDYPGISVIRNKLLELFKTQPKDTWIQTNIDRIKTTKIDPIVKYINSKGHGGEVAILGFNNCLNPKSLSDEFYDLIQQEKQKKRIPPPVSPATLPASPVQTIPESRPTSPLSFIGFGRKRTHRRKRFHKKTRKIRRHK